MAEEYTKKFRNVALRDKYIIYKGNALQHRWVKFTRDVSDGYANWQKGQVVEWVWGSEKLLLYLEHGQVVPTDPQEDKPVDDSNQPFAWYRMTDKVMGASGVLAAGSEQRLPCRLGDKWVERGLAVMLKPADDTDNEETEKRRRGRPRNAMREDSR